MKTRASTIKCKPLTTGTLPSRIIAEIGIGMKTTDRVHRRSSSSPFSATMRSLVTTKKTMQRTQRRLRNTKGSRKQRRQQLLPPSTPSSHGKSHCSSTKVLQNNKRRNFVLQQFFSNDEVHQRQAAHVVQIALSFQAACMQPQPAFKIRHIKLGARMAEPRGCSGELFQQLRKEHQFDPFEAVFKLYHEPFIAFSIKLQLLKAVYALLDTRLGIAHFLKAPMNGYEAVIEALKTAKLTRSKYVLQAIIKKMHLWEALGTVHHCCRRLFLERNPEKSKDAEFKTETVILCKKIEYSFQMLMEAVSTSQLSYQQPRRFLPVSKKFEVVTDSMAQGSFANALQSFLRNHALAESLLLTRPHFSPTPPAPICPPQIQIKC
ncbi:protein virilizer-like [Drosophila ananassae]|uniref:protein virilizer-like n=1 Tax=Drosophila ananassae TaxID=7217 RepID=UPI001CFF7DF0|nr:protein virilizer-like [Drosophila ananassae]XP_044574096.1 protein virilizer-like [Drosophila ananassae]